MANLNETNQTAKHTPGPWKVQVYENGKVHGVIMEKSEWDTPFVCRFDPACSANAIDNARLIAAAPTMYEENIKLKELNSELLEALKELAYVVGYSYKDAPALVKAKAAITKSTSTNPSNQSK